MARAFVDGETLHVELSTADKLWSIHGSFRVPLAHVVGVTTTKPPGFFDALKLIGLNWPWGKMAGSFLFHGEVVFFDYAGHEDAVLVVELADEVYRHLFIHIDAPDTPAAAAERIHAARAGGD